MVKKLGIIISIIFGVFIFIGGGFIFFLQNYAPSLFVNDVVRNMEKESVNITSYSYNFNYSSTNVEFQEGQFIKSDNFLNTKFYHKDIKDGKKLENLMYNGHIFVNESDEWQKYITDDMTNQEYKNTVNNFDYYNLTIINFIPLLKEHKDDIKLKQMNDDGFVLYLKLEDEQSTYTINNKYQLEKVVIIDENKNQVTLSFSEINSLEEIYMPEELISD